MYMNEHFRYRDFSMTELDEMIDAQKNARTDDIIKDNARFRQSLRKILYILQERLSGTDEDIEDIEALCKEQLA